MKILVACEYSGRVREQFRMRGHDAISCDLLASDLRGPHFQGDVRGLLEWNSWDMLIGFPPCTYICNSSSKHLYIGKKKENGRDPERWAAMRAGALFFKALYDAPVEKVCVENPVMLGYAKEIIGAEPSQIIQPWQHGHREMKGTCLWLRNLPLLEPSDVVGPPPKEPNKRKHWAKVHRAAPGPDRWKQRSLTYMGIAQAMAEQWG